MGGSSGYEFGDGALGSDRKLWLLIINFSPLPNTPYSSIRFYDRLMYGRAAGISNMLGIFQKSNLRIEVEASEAVIRDSLLRSNELKQWLWSQRFVSELPEQLHTGLKFTTWVGPVAIQHLIQVAQPNRLRFLLSGGIDGFHEWYWGEGWVQSRLEGVSLLPLNLGQTLSLLQLKQFLAFRGTREF